MMKKATIAILLILSGYFAKAQGSITDSATLRSYINANIKTNGNREITGAMLNAAFNGTMNVLKLLNGKVDSVWIANDSIRVKTAYATYKYPVASAIDTTINATRAYVNYKHDIQEASINGRATYGDVRDEIADSLQAVRDTLNAHNTRIKTLNETKATDNSVVHKAGDETITGKKIHTDSLRLEGVIPLTFKNPVNGSPIQWKYDALGAPYLSLHAETEVGHTHEAFGFQNRNPLSATRLVLKDHLGNNTMEIGASNLTGRQGAILFNPANGSNRGYVGFHQDFTGGTRLPGMTWEQRGKIFMLGLNNTSDKWWGVFDTDKGWFKWGDTSYASTKGFQIGTGLYLNPDSVSVTTDTANNKPLTIDASGNVKKAQSWYGAGGGGGITALTGDVTASGTGSVTATLSNTGVTAGTYSSVIVNSQGRTTFGYPQVQSLTYSSNITMNINNGLNAYVTLTGNVSSFTFTNLYEGATGEVVFIQDGTGGRTLSGISPTPRVGGNSGGVVTLSTPANAWDAMSYKYINGTLIIGYIKMLN